MSIALIVTRGFGNGTLTGDINKVVTRGYTIGEAPDTWTPVVGVSSAWSDRTQDDSTWSDRTTDDSVWNPREGI